MKTQIEQLCQTHNLDDQSLKKLIEGGEWEQELFSAADQVRKQHYGTAVYIRGLIEVSNYCKNNCHYCGIRKGNEGVNRYRLTEDEILSCCTQGYALGFRTFVLQGGEDEAYSDEFICGVVSKIKALHSDCAVTLSLGEKPSASYQAYFDAGADRYLLRHETANADHYKQLHPKSMLMTERLACLRELKRIGYQVGSGFMVGSPYQKTEYLIEDLRFLQQLQPEMIGIGPFMSHANTPFGVHASGDLHTCLRLISILRLLFPYALIPATTALSSIAPNGRELGLKAGANVVMPNLSPLQNRKMYELYDNKLFVNEEAAEYCKQLRERIAAAGYEMVTDIGHAKRG